MIVSTISIMDTIIQPAAPRAKRRAYRSHTEEFKRAAVEQTLVEGASVSLIAREHNVNTNQLFGWRKLYREGRLGNAAPESITLLPITVADEPREMPPTPQPSPTPVCAGLIELEIGKAKLRIQGKVDVAVLGVVLERVLR